MRGNGYVCLISFKWVPKLFGYNLMKGRVPSLQMEIRFSYLKLVLDRGPECIFGVSPLPDKPVSFLTWRLNRSYIVSPLSRSDLCALPWRYQILVVSEETPAWFSTVDLPRSVRT
ncbi:hypothetical protein AVEN_247162-1 [Araneus ventricosus]|uniref:Uncharacterized protein n=1 Tax=Araneus ventricosus TaxID=182803 RepID=A0A4Y2UCA6_ARAVE|nr:hypothetical protein AVEN_247162-1 [Araneus ventricosus]